MKLTIEQAALAKALATAVNVAPKRNTIPILGNVLIDAQTDVADGLVWIIATDQSIEARCAVPAVIAEPGQVTVPAGLLSDIARHAPGGADLTLQWDRDADPRATVQFGRSRYNLPTLAAGDFPVWPSGTMPHTLTLSAVDLAQMIDRVASAVSTEAVRYYLHGAYTHRSPDRPTHLRMATTNGHRMAWAEMPATFDTGDVDAVIIPSNALAQFSRALDGRAGEVQLRVGPAGCRLEVENLIISSKLVDGSFPDYVRVVPRDWENEVIVDRALLAAAVQRTALVTDDRTLPIKLDFADDRLRLTARNTTQGQGEEEIEVEITHGGAFEVGFNARYVQQVLGLHGADRILIRATGPAGPTRFEPLVADAEHGDFLNIIMPMRV